MNSRHKGRLQGRELHKASTANLTPATCIIPWQVTSAQQQQSVSITQCTHHKQLPAAQSLSPSIGLAWTQVANKCGWVA
jgi:hypothetical protein